MDSNIQCNVSQKCQRQIFFRPTRSSRSRLITRVLFENNGRRELKETQSSNWKIPCQAIIDHRAIENSVSTNHIWRERKETTTANFGRNVNRRTTTLVKSRNLKQQILRKHGLLKNKDDKHVNGGSSECTVILSVMYHSNVSGRSDIRALLIARAFPLVSVYANLMWFIGMDSNIQCNVSQKCQRQIFFRRTRSSRSRLITRVLFENNGRRELKETQSSNPKIPCQAVMFSIRRKHGLLKNKDGKHVNSGSSECTVILGVMYHSNMRGRCDVRAVLIARAFPLVSVVFRAIHFLFVSVRRIERSSRLCFQHGYPLQMAHQFASFSAIAAVHCFL
ncbi:hypothetical protein T01_3395 [Trichinella spiralis]|uniref:Uncharacterized protein n=1 Tax=Trichinella spiralis TaxID=6334 RepID=A0A0V1BA04_TRISP|nr:hypothetical protein T01_3395 [Trichinella spiralis]